MKFSRVWMRFRIVWMRFSRVWMRFRIVWMRFSRVWMRFRIVWMRFSQMWLRFSRVWMRFSRVWMRFCQVWMRLSRVWMRFKRVRMTECGWDLAVCGWDLAECCDLLSICQHHHVHYNSQFATQVGNSAHSSSCISVLHLAKIGTGRNEQIWNKFPMAQWTFVYVRMVFLFITKKLLERVTLNASCLWKLRQGHLTVVRNDTSQKPDSYRWTVPIIRYFLLIVEVIKNICFQECGRFMENISNIHTKDCYTEGGQCPGNLLFSHKL
jgi:hypothetical protein